MAKVLILKAEISAYNVPTLNIIANHHNLTVGYFTKDKSTVECKFHKMKFDVCHLGPFILVKNLKKVCKNYDVVTFIPDLHVLSYCLLPFSRRNFKAISWSIGFRVSYIHPYITNRKHNILDWLFKQVLSHCDANIFYMNKAREFWNNSCLRTDNIFQAINTATVAPIEFLPAAKKDFLFVGTLYKGNGLDLLLNAFNKVVHEYDTDTKLRIVGAGDQREILEKYVVDNGLETKVVFHGAIYDESEISKIFQQSILCFSPTQAGLSVPKSMGYGVPFVTRKDAITGGEIYHITSGKNGIMYDSNDDLPAIMADAIKHRSKYLDMGRLALDYYQSSATVEHMAQGALDAIDFVLAEIPTR